MELKSPFEHLQFSAELACELFAVFSRFEYALKENGYRKKGFKGAAEPNWDKFANDIAGPFEEDQPAATAEAVTYLLSEPPMRQAIEHHLLTWKPLAFPNVSETHKVLLAVRMVRNNLFHGGKHTPHSPPGRDEKLVQASLVVLKRCLLLHEHVRFDYETSVF